MTAASQSNGPDTTLPTQLSAFQSQRPINQPPYRLDFDPVASPSLKKEQPTFGEESLNGKHPDQNGAPQGSISVPLNREGSASPSPQTVTLNRNPHLRRPTTARGVVYMLHGWAQNVHVFSNRARKLTKRLTKAGYKVVFLQGPHRLPPVEGTSTRPTVGANEQESQNSNPKEKHSTFSREYAYAWFLYDNNGDQSTTEGFQTPILEPSLNGNFQGMDDSLEFLRNELRKDRIKCLETRNEHKKAGAPPFFLLGFSQGAVLVHKIATLACQDVDNIYNSTSCCDLNKPWRDVKKCILVSGFSFTTSIRTNDGSDVNKHNDGEAIQSDSPGSTVESAFMPSFHVVGRRDSRVSPCLTLELHDMEPCFRGRVNVDKVLWEHDRGHVLPQDRNFSDRLLEFLAVPP